MYLLIMGFLPDEFDDDSLKYRLKIDPEFESSVMEVLSWENLEDNCQGGFLLTSQQVEDISREVSESLPVDLELFIGVFAS